jgi:hypothetical protein
VRFANTFSKQPITLKNVAIAVSKDGSEIDAATQKNLKFSGQLSATIQPGKDVFSDALKFKLKPDSRLAITIAFGDVPDDITGHPGSRTTSFILSGNNVQSVDFAGAIPTDHWYVISSLDVQTKRKAGAVAVLGNSIADGRGSGVNKQNRWPDIFSQKLLSHPETSNYGVLNLGIGGNCVLVVGVENGDNFRLLHRQRHLFKARKVLLVSRYPQSDDLRNWLLSVPNDYLHFGDFDLAGIHIYLTEFYKYLGNRASFFVPDDIEIKLKNGNATLYDRQYARFCHLVPEDVRLIPLVEMIHRYHRVYEQEGYISSIVFR